MKSSLKRPSKMEEFIGKDHIKNSLQIYIHSALKQNKNLEHVLFYGVPGVGKTSLATIIANELKKSIHYIQGPSIQKISDVLDMISMINEGDIIFIDEIHKINSKCLEMFYSILEDFVVDIKIGKEWNSQYSRMTIPHFTLIGSTTNIGNLPIAFIERFGIKYYIDFYTHDEICQIIKSFNLDTISLTYDEIDYIAMHSKFTPRIAINLLNRYYDFKISNNNLSKEQIFESIGIYKFGLTELDINYLKILNKNCDHPMGIKTLSQQLFIDEKTIIQIIEPFLLKLDLLIKTTNGRLITVKGKEYLSTI